MVSIEVPASLSFRHLLMRALARFCRALEQPSSFTDGVLSAAGEAFNNAVLHGASASDPNVVEVEISVEQEALVLRICDYGSGFTLADQPVITDIPGLSGLDNVDGPEDLDETAVNLLPESGMGLYIMRACMAEVTYQPGAPNVLSMRKPLIPTAGPRGGLSQHSA